MSTPVARLHRFGTVNANSDGVGCKLSIDRNQARSVGVLRAAVCHRLELAGVGLLSSTAT